MKFCYNINFTLPKQSQRSRSILQDVSRSLGLFWKEKTLVLKSKKYGMSDLFCNIYTCPLSNNSATGNFALDWSFIGAPQIVGNLVVISCMKALSIGLGSTLATRCVSLALKQTSGYVFLLRFSFKCVFLGLSWIFQQTVQQTWAETGALRESPTDLVFHLCAGLVKTKERDLMFKSQSS